MAAMYDPTFQRAAGVRTPPQIDPITGQPIATGFVPSTNIIDPNDLTPRFSMQEMGGAMMIPGMPGLPAYPGIAGVNELFDPNFGRTETITLGAENAIAGGFGMGGFGQNQTNRLLDSERKANFLAGHQILEPYLQRDFEAKENAANRASRLNEIAAEGAQALQRLQLSESGQGQRLSAELTARLQQQVVEGQQAMQRLTLQEAGDTSRQREQIGGNLANTYLSAILSGKSGGTSTSARPGTPGNPYTAANPSGAMGPTFYGSSGTGIAPVRPGGSYGAYDPFTSGSSSRPATDTGFNLGSSAIDQLLRKYGLL